MLKISCSKWSSVCFSSFRSGLSKIVTGNFGEIKFCAKIPSSFLEDKRRKQSISFFQFPCNRFSLLLQVVYVWLKTENERTTIKIFLSYYKEGPKNLGNIFLKQPFIRELFIITNFNIVNVAKIVNKFNILIPILIYIQFSRPKRVNGLQHFVIYCLIVGKLY